MIIQIPPHLEISQQVKQQYAKHGTAWDKDTKRRPRGSPEQCSMVLLKRGCIWEYQEKDYNEALACYEAAISLNSDNEEAFYRKGVVLFLKSHYSEAKKCFKTILEDFEDHCNADAWARLGECYFYLHDFQKAFDMFSRSIEKARRKVLQDVVMHEVIFSKAKLHCILFNNFTQPAKDFNRILYTSDNPEHKIGALKHLGFIKLIKHDFTGALNCFKKAKRCAVLYDEEEGWFQLWKAFCYIALDDDRAWKCFNSSWHSDKKPKRQDEYHLLKVFIQLALRRDVADNKHFFRDYDKWRQKHNVLWEYAYLPKFIVELIFECEEVAMDRQQAEGNNGSMKADQAAKWFLHESLIGSDKWRYFYRGDFASLEVFKNGTVLKWAGYKDANKLLNQAFGLPDYYIITRIYAIQNNDLKEQFYDVTEELTARYPYYRLNQGNAATKESMESYIHEYGFRASSEVTFIPVLHGLRNPDNEVIWKAGGICSTGFHRVNSQDPGHFGQGISFTTCSSYALQVYCQENNFGEKVLVIGQAAVGRAYPCEPSGLRGQGCKPGYDAHYGRFHPRSNPSVELDEWVFFDTRQVLPQYVVCVRDKSIVL